MSGLLDILKSLSFYYFILLGKVKMLSFVFFDFVMFALKPQKGTLVTGFGQAYIFEPGTLADAVQLTDKNIEQYR